LEKTAVVRNFIRIIKTRRMEWEGHAAQMGEECIQNTDEKSRGRRLGISRRRWLDNIKIDLQ
jgi:hypothetical protein